MERQAFLTLTTSSQWVLFLAIGLIIYFWIEKKNWIQQLGQLVFLLLGIFALWVIASNQLIVPEVSSDSPVPVEVKTLTFFWGLVVTGLIGMFAIIAGLKHPAWSKKANLFIVSIGMALFFMVYQLQRL